MDTRQTFPQAFSGKLKEGSKYSGVCKRLSIDVVTALVAALTVSPIMTAIDRYGVDSGRVELC
jgi:hypothetical protein